MVTKFKFVARINFFYKKITTKWQQNLNLSLELTLKYILRYNIIDFIKYSSLTLSMTLKRIFHLPNIANSVGK